MLRPFGFGRGYRDRLEAPWQELDAPRRRHGGGGIRRCLGESGTLSLVRRLDSMAAENDDDDEINRARVVPANGRRTDRTKNPKNPNKKMPTKMWGT